MDLVIVDDDYLVVDSLKTIIESNSMNVVGIGYSGQEAIELYKKHKPGIMLLDIRMKDLSGIEATKEILAFDRDAKILLITTFNDEEYISQAISLGCMGYILKENIKGLIPAIKAINSGNLVFDSKIISNIELEKSKKKDLDSYLTKREQDIVLLVAEGFNNKEIGESLYLSEGTIKNYISRILNKLDLRDRTQLVVWYYKK